jgi:hypothetical protein
MDVCVFAVHTIPGQIVECLRRREYEWTEWESRDTVGIIFDSSESFVDHVSEISPFGLKTLCPQFCEASLHETAQICVDMYDR